MNIGQCISSAAPAAAPTGSSQLVDQGQGAQLSQRATFSALFKDIAQSPPDERATSDIEALVPPADSLAAPTSANVSVDMSPFSRLEQGEVSSTLSKALAQILSDEEVAVHSEPDTSIDSISSSDTGTQSTLASMMGFVSADDDTGQNLPEGISAEAVCAEFAQTAQPSIGQGGDVLAVASQGMRMAQTYRSDAKGQDRATINATLAAPTDLPDSQVTQLLADKGSQQTAVGTTNELTIRDGRGFPVDPVPAPLERSSGNLTLVSSPLPGTLGLDRWPSSVLEHQGTRNVPAAGYGNGAVQAQGTAVTVPLDSLAVPAVGVRGGGEQNPFGTNAEGAGEADLSHSGNSQFQESLTRDNQSLFFSSQFGSARQAQAPLQGAGASVATPAEDHLKMAQAFLGEDRAATMTSASGKAQTVHVELPLHESGPLSVRISMTDQTVHTQFTTDRNDLGALLLTRQDQLQQTLVKSGLELGQFQVHIDQRGQQDAAPDRQPRRNGDASEQQQGLPNHNQDARDRERPNHRPPSALSLFA